jgi:hypothetical protein
MKEDATIDAVAAQIAARWLRHRPPKIGFIRGSLNRGRFRFGYLGLGHMGQSRRCRALRDYIGNAPRQL